MTKYHNFLFHRSMKGVMFCCMKMYVRFIFSLSRLNKWVCLELGLKSLSSSDLTKLFYLYIYDTFHDNKPTIGRITDARFHRYNGGKPVDQTSRWCPVWYVTREFW